MKQTFSEGDGSILDGMVLVDLKIPFRMNHQVHHAVLANLLKHVVKETESCLYVAFACAIKIHFDIYVGLLGGALHLCDTLTSKEQFCYLVPCNTFIAKDQ